MFASHFKDYRSGQEKRVVKSHKWMKTAGKTSWRQERSRFHIGELWHKWKGCHGEY